jgi:hypothetical protein
MIAPFARFIDWSAIQIVWGRRLGSLIKWRNDSADSRLDAAIQFLKGPDFVPAESQPARLEFTGALEFRFPPPRPGEFAENNVVYGRLYRGPGQWQKRPAIILLHGGGGDPDYHYRFPRVVRRCNRAEFNVATLMAPFQFQRRPRQIERIFNWPNWKISRQRRPGQTGAGSTGSRLE